NGRIARSFAGVGAPRRDGASTVEEESRRSQFLARLAAVCRALCEGAAAQNDSKFVIHAGVDLRFVGGNRLCPRGCDGACGNSRRNGPPSCATGFARG